ncbi:MAG: hypothetical protein C0428_03915 [Polaromonas sp.]|nr:hypothetical protein [Polaromonas sp.]
MLMIFHSPRHPPSPTRPGTCAASAVRASPALWLLGTGLALSTAACLFAAGALAQPAVPAPAPAVTATAAPAEPKYTVAQIAQAFGFIDGNKDGKLSREEAAGFRGVARHFDAADSNKDGLLSRREFESALAGDKNR